MVLACSGLLVSIGCGWNLLPELEAITGWIWSSERLLWKGKWTISRLNSLLKWHAFFSAAILLVGTLNSCIRSMGMIINAELRIQILPFLLHLSILSLKKIQVILCKKHEFDLNLCNCTVKTIHSFIDAMIKTRPWHNVSELKILDLKEYCFQDLYLHNFCNELLLLISFM